MGGTGTTNIVHPLVSLRTQVHCYDRSLQKIGRWHLGSPLEATDVGKLGVMRSRRYIKGAQLLSPDDNRLCQETQEHVPIV